MKAGASGSPDTICFRGLRALDMWEAGRVQKQAPSSHSWARIRGPHLTPRALTPSLAHWLRVPGLTLLRPSQPGDTSSRVARSLRGLKRL